MPGIDLSLDWSVRSTLPHGKAPWMVLPVALKLLGDNHRDRYRPEGGFSIADKILGVRLKARTFTC